MEVVIAKDAESLEDLVRNGEMKYSYIYFGHKDDRIVKLLVTIQRKADFF